MGNSFSYSYFSAAAIPAILPGSIVFVVVGGLLVGGWFVFWYCGGWLCSPQFACSYLQSPPLSDGSFMMYGNNERTMSH